MSESAAIFYRLASLDDPEELLEDAAMWKALHDEYGDAISTLRESPAPAGSIVFGRSRSFAALNPNPVSAHLPYWRDPAFLARSGRSFEVLPFEDAIAAVVRMHARGRGAFLKSTRSKHAIFRVPVGIDPGREIGDMAFSFIDGGPALMVQDLCHVEFEHRFLCIDREIITHSPVQWMLTPIDRPRPGTLYRTPRDKLPVHAPDTFIALLDLALSFAQEMATPHACIDCAMINGAPGIIELNPMRIGEVGLYACDVRRVARASRKLVVESGDVS